MAPEPQFVTAWSSPRVPSELFGSLSHQLANWSPLTACTSVDPALLYEAELLQFDTNGGPETQLAFQNARPVSGPVTHSQSPSISLSDAPIQMFFAFWMLLLTNWFSCELVMVTR